MNSFVVPTGWRADIGLEVHAQLATQSKLFCSSSNEAGQEPNRNVGFVDAGFPGVLPVLNRKAVELAVKAGLAFQCQIQSVSVWSRKHYFYPDLPKGYQITQFDRPICLGGNVPIRNAETSKSIRLKRIHMEEDAGKTIHSQNASYVDLNRAGCPLVEIVTEPDMHLPWEAAAVMRSIRTSLRAVGVCHGDLERGHLRCDVNVSVRKERAAQLGVKVELKNLNSFRFVEKAIEYEIVRQIEALEGGQKIIQETRGFDSEVNETFPMRLKEDAHDYRYFPDPDLPLLRISEADLATFRKDFPVLPHEWFDRMVDSWGLTYAQAEVISSSGVLTEMFVEVTGATGPTPRLKNFQLAANWIVTTVLRDADNSGEVEVLPIKSKDLGKILQLIESGKLSQSLAKSLYDDVLRTGRSPEELIQEKGMVQVSDEGLVEQVLTATIEEHPDVFAELVAGKDKVRKFLTGQVMKRSGGKINPQVLNRILDQRVEREKKK